MVRRKRKPSHSSRQASASSIQRRFRVGKGLRHRKLVGHIHRHRVRLQSLRAQRRDFGLIMRTVRADVAAATQNRQLPLVTDSLVGDIVLADR